MTSQPAFHCLARRIAEHSTFLRCLSLFLTAPLGCSAHSGSAVTPSEEHFRPEAQPEPQPAKQALVLADSGSEVLRFSPGTTYEVSTRKLPGEWPRVVPQSELASWHLPLDTKATSWLLLDEHPARYAQGRSLSLPDLINEDEELAPGFHWLSVVLVGADEPAKLEVSLQVIAVEEEPAGLPRAPGCALLWPVGTYNGAKSSRSIEVLALPRQGSVEQVAYEAISGDWRMRGSADFGASLLMTDAPSGDITISATCIVGGTALPSVTQVVTVNREAPEQERTP